jgi:hypothetical protein
MILCNIYMYILLGKNIYSTLRMSPLYSIVPEFVLPPNNLCQMIYTLLCSSIIGSIVSFELDDDFVLPDVLNDDRWSLSQSTQLTHIQITLYYFEHCINLLKQLGSQLCSFTVSVIFVTILYVGILSQIESVINIY